MATSITGVASHLTMSCNPVLNTKDLTEIPDIQKFLSEFRLYNGKYPSVTSLLKFIRDDTFLAHLPNIEELRARGMADGRFLHGYIEDSFNCDIFKEYELTPIREVLIESWNEFVTSYIKLVKPMNEPESISQYLEYTLIDNELGLAGTLDLIARVDSNIVLFDWKTCKKQLNPETLTKYKLQVSKYSMMFEKQEGIPVNEAWIVALFKNKAGFKIYKIDRKEILYWDNIYNAELVPLYNNLLELLKT